MAATGHFRSGKGSRIQANGTNLSLAEWKVTDRADDLDTTNFESGSQEQGTTGVEGLDFSFGGNWDAQQNKFDSPPGIFPQDTFPGLKFYTSVSDAVFWNLPTSRILSAENGAQVRQLVTFNASGKGQPGWSRPTGSV